jgi:hypothetical protein
MNARAILFLCGGMSLSFAAVLATLLAVLDTSPSSPPPRRVALQAAPPASLPSDSRPARSASLPRDRSATPSPSQAVASPLPEQSLPSREQLAPDPATLQQLAGLKQEIRRELTALKKDRDALLADLARTLATLPPAQAARELAALDDEAVALALWRVPEKPRQAILDQMEPRRAQAVRRRLQALASG